MLRIVLLLDTGADRTRALVPSSGCRQPRQEQGVPGRATAAGARRRVAGGGAAGAAGQRAGGRTTPEAVQPEQRARQGRAAAQDGGGRAEAYGAARELRRARVGEGHACHLGIHYAV